MKFTQIVLLGALFFSGVEGIKLQTMQKENPAQNAAKAKVAKAAVQHAVQKKAEEHAAEGGAAGAQPHGAPPPAVK